MTRSTLAVLVLGASLTACGLPLEGADVTFTNTCAADSDCAAGSACVATRGGNICAATSADLGPVYVEVRTTNMSGVASAYLFKDVVVMQGDNTSGFVERANLDLPRLARFFGTYRTEGDACAAEDGSLPVKVELRTSGVPAGFANQLSVKSVLSGGSHLFETSVPPGTYDVYIAPEAREGCAEPPPPRFFPAALVVPADVAEIELTPTMGPPELLDVVLQVPATDTLDGWLFELVDPAYGRPISMTVTLAAPTSATIELTLPYYYTSNALLRLRDPDSDLVVHWALDSADLDGDGTVELDLRDLVATPLAVTGTVVSGVGVYPGANVVVQSKTLTGSANQNATYRTATVSKTDGTIEVTLVPGNYAVTIVPNTPGVGMLQADWEIKLEPNGTITGNGKGFELPAQPLLIGSAFTPTGEPAGQTPVVVGPSQPGVTSYFAQTLGQPTLLPRQLAGVVGSNGKIELPVDPGTVDLSVQVSSETGYAWAVLPRLLVNAADNAPRVDVGEIEIPHPAVLEGTVRSPTGAMIAYAVVRAWLPVEPGSDGGTSPLVQIGETITDASGNYFLPLPPSITLPAAD